MFLFVVKNENEKEKICNQQLKKIFFNFCIISINRFSHCKYLSIQKHTHTFFKTFYGKRLRAKFVQLLSYLEIKKRKKFKALSLCIYANLFPFSKNCNKYRKLEFLIHLKKNYFV